MNTNVAGQLWACATYTESGEGGNRTAFGGAVLMRDLPIMVDKSRCSDIVAFLREWADALEGKNDV